MTFKAHDADAILDRATPLLHQHAQEVQPYGHIVAVPIALSASARQAPVDNLNQLLADTMTLRDLYKKHHWQASGPTFHQLHLLFDAHLPAAARPGGRRRGADSDARRGQPAMGVDVAEAVRLNEQQAWFVAEHLVDLPLVRAV